ncbi:MAG: folylpolyglutamate synthase/dihydrofolate synthase family protein [Crocinitomicaceae bacterium]
MEEINKIKAFDTYEQVIDWLFVQLPNYQAQGTAAYKPGLDNITALLEGIGNPHQKLKTIHIAGTNGKGSVAHMLSAIYLANDYSVGTFTSPHISDFRERIKLNGEFIDAKFVMDFVNRYKELIDEIGATFFEINTAIAFLAFAEAGVDIAVIETGLGGRLDSTNVLQPEISIITSIGIDHAEFLGESLVEIAREKGGIIKENVPVVIGADQKEVIEELSLIAINKHASIHYPEREIYDLDLLGMYQQRNAEIAVCAAKTLKPKFPLDDAKIAYGLSHVVQLTKLQGRFQLIQKEPLVILDAAHNPSGVKGLIEEVNELDYDQLHMVYGSASDKDLKGIFELLPKSAQYYFTEFNSKRSTKKSRYEEMGNQFVFEFELFDQPTKALNAALEAAKSDDLIMIFGSFYMMDEILH